jgi:hypothetical protein
MYRVLTCPAGQHDWRLVLLAVLVCFVASVVAVNIFHRAIASRGRTRLIWIAIAGAAIGYGIWATHFIAMLAYAPGVPTLIARAVVRFAASLGKITTAEGVETSEQLDIIRAEACVEMRGHYFSPPIRDSEVAQNDARASLRNIKRGLRGEPFQNDLTRRANHRHIVTIARIKPAPKNRSRAFSIGLLESGS